MVRLTTDYSKATIQSSLDNINALILECDKAIERYGEYGFVHTHPIIEFHPFKVNTKRSPPHRAESFRLRLIKAKKSLEGKLNGL